MIGIVWVMATLSYLLLVTRTHKYYLERKGVFADNKDLETGRLFWIRSDNKCIFIRGCRKGFVRDRSQYDHRGRDWNDLTTNQGMPVATRAGNKEGIFPREPPIGAQPWYLDHGQVILILDSCLPELWGNEFL